MEIITIFRNGQLTDGRKFVAAMFVVVVKTVGPEQHSHHHHLVAQQHHLFAMEKCIVLASTLLLQVAVKY